MAFPRRLPESQPVRQLACVRPMYGLRGAVQMRTLEVHACPGGPSLGTLHASLADTGRLITSLEPTGAHDLHSRAEAVVDIATESFATAGFQGGERFSANETLQRVQAVPPHLPAPHATTPRARMAMHTVMRRIFLTSRKIEEPPPRD